MNKELKAAKSFKQLMTEDYGNHMLRYVGSIFGEDEDPKPTTGDDMYDGLLQMFGEDALDADPVLGIHPAHTGAQRGWYIQAGDIWYKGQAVGEECVFEVLD